MEADDPPEKPPEDEGAEDPCDQPEDEDDPWYSPPDLVGEEPRDSADADLDWAE